MRGIWCKFCLWLVSHWPFNAVGWSFKPFLFFLPWAGEVEDGTGKETKA